jgi:transposase-like protein
MVVRITGDRMYLWRAVDNEGGEFILAILMAGRPLINDRHVPRAARRLRMGAVNWGGPMSHASSGRGLVSHDA